VNEVTSAEPISPEAPLMRNLGIPAIL
jgi:hypothetical protein